MRFPLGVIDLLAVPILGRRKGLLIDFEFNVVFRVEVVDYPADLRSTSEHALGFPGADGEGESSGGGRDLIQNKVTALARVPNVLLLPRFIPILGRHGVGERGGGSHYRLDRRQRELHWL